MRFPSATVSSIPQRQETNCTVIPKNDFLIDNHFAYSASQGNTDLAIAAQCELEGDFSVDGDAL